MEQLRVKNWRQFQHYKDRNPPWIKLHFALLSSPDWVMLDDASRVLAIACMLIASRNEGVVPANPAYLKRVAYLRKTPDFKPLIECGFLELASNVEQKIPDARPEERRDREETETEEKVASSANALSASDPVNGNAIAYIPLNDGTEFGVSKELAAELTKLYPAVDVPQTLNEIRGWNLAHSTKRKTRKGVVAHINTWMQKEQNRG